MRIQAISNYNKLSFCGDKRSKNTDRAVTVQDLYEMEDRIKKQNADLFAKQNKLIGNTLNRLTRVAYLSPDEGSDNPKHDVHHQFNLACADAYVLIHNGKDKKHIAESIRNDE